MSIKYPMDCWFSANSCQLNTMDCQLNDVNSCQLNVILSANWIPIKCQLNANLVLMDWHYGSASSQDRLLGHFPICFDTHQLAEDQDHKGTPFEYFPGVLSTNEKPRFRALDQWEARFMARAKFWSIQCTANRILLNGSFSGISLICQWNAN